MSEVLFFGSKGAGHLLYSKHNPQIQYYETPWKHLLDGGVIGLHQKDGWTAYGFADYSGDSRPGSNSVFLTDSLVSADELLTEAFNQWPEIWNRRGFPIAPHHCPTCKREWPQPERKADEPK